MRYQVGVAGHSGYSGTELLQLLTHHPHFDPVLLDHREPGQGEARSRQYRDLHRIPFTPDAVRGANLDAVFLATSPEVSMEAAPWLLKVPSMRVVDLSGAFRLRTPERYQRWYGAAHQAPELFSRAVYGLPEYNRAAIANAEFVSNPGCYPTAANLAIAPLIEAGLIDRSAGVVCDAKSGVSGAGRKASLKTSFCEITGNFSAYSVLNHRHIPEVLQVSCLQESEFALTAQLIPIDRGILETIYIRSSADNIDRIDEVYRNRYGAEAFVRVYEAGSVPDIRAVAHTNFCDIGWVADPANGRAVVVAAIDNLGKGAAGQAIQNLNLMFGFPETEGLL